MPVQWTTTTAALFPYFGCGLSYIFFMFHAEVEDMSEEERQDRALGFAKLTLGGKSELERAAVLHQNIGSRAMAEMMIETFEPCPGKP